MVHDHPHKHSVSVSAIIFNDDGKVLATKRRDTGAWVPPGGVLELHEPIENGLRREVAEETGLQIVIERLTGVYKNTATGVISLAFRCRPLNDDQVGTSEETSAACWMSPADAMDQMAKPFAMRVEDAHSSKPPRIANVAFTNITAAKPRIPQ